MAILDIRNNQQKGITEIKFDATSDKIFGDEQGLQFSSPAKNPEIIFLCYWEDFYNFIAACHKARELWGPK